MSVNISVSRQAHVYIFVTACLAITVLTLHVIYSPNDYVAAPLSNFAPATVEKLCSFEILQDSIKKLKHFPSEGTWFRTEPRTAEYQPSICKFEYQKTLSLPKTYFEECAEKKGLRNILILGDSNAGLQHIGFVQLLEASNFSCEVMKQEKSPDKFMPDVNYFSIGTGIAKSDVVVHVKDCASCFSRKTKCSKKKAPGSQLEIEVEYISMEFLQDTEVTTFRPRYTKQCPPIPMPCFVSSTYQQFIFGEYLRKCPNYPDVIFLHSNNHDMRRRSLQQIRVDIQTVISLIREYVPQTSKVVWFTTPGENVKKKSNIWLKEMFKLPSENLTSDAMIVRMNRDLFQVLEPELTRPNTNILPFFDIESMGKVVRGSWIQDGLHMRPEWHQHIVSYIMQTLCNSNFKLK